MGTFRLSKNLYQNNEKIFLWIEQKISVLP